MRIRCEYPLEETLAIPDSQQKERGKGVRGKEPNRLADVRKEKGYTGLGVHV
jgi:hypothetical protein